MTTEQVLDMLPAVAEILEKIEYKKLIMESKKKYKIKKMEDVEVVAAEAVMDLLPAIMKRTKEVKAEIFEIVSIAENKTVEEVKAQSIAQTLQTFKAIFSDKETVELFKSAV